MAEATSTPANPTQNYRPFWLPDTQGFLAVAIIAIVAILSLMLLTGAPKFDDKVAGAFMTLLGVLTACLKDVYSFFFGSSRGSDKKDDVISAIATTPTPPIAMTPAQMQGEATLKNGELTYFRTLPDEDSRVRFLAMTQAERTAAIGKA